MPRSFLVKKRKLATKRYDNEVRHIKSNDLLIAQQWPAADQYFPTLSILQQQYIFGFRHNPSPTNYDTEDKPIDYSLKKKVNSNAVECESSKTVSECSNDSREETLPAPPTNITSDKLTIDGRSKRKKTVPEIRTKYTKFSCHACGRHYATSSNLSRHKQTHRSIDSSQAKKCPHCDKVYVSMPALSMHILTHKLKHQCTICDKAFSRPWLLQGHMRSHTGERPYGCTRCNKKFADRSNLRAHVQTHSEEKEFKCEKCGKTFAVRSYLTKHMECSCQSEDDCGEQ